MGMPSPNNSPKNDPPGSHRRRWIIIAIAAVLLIVGSLGIGISLTVRNSVKPELINETASLSEAILAQGTMYNTSQGGIIRKEGVLIGIYSVGRDDDGVSRAEISFGAADLHTGGVQWVRLGDKFTLADVGTVYLYSLYSFSTTQQVEVLFIPET